MRNAVSIKEKTKGWLQFIIGFAGFSTIIPPLEASFTFSFPAENFYMQSQPF